VIPQFLCFQSLYIILFRPVVRFLWRAEKGGEVSMGIVKAVLGRLTAWGWLINNSWLEQGVYRLAYFVFVYLLHFSKFDFPRSINLGVFVFRLHCLFGLLLQAILKVNINVLEAAHAVVKDLEKTIYTCWIIRRVIWRATRAKSDIAITVHKTQFTLHLWCVWRLEEPQSRRSLGARNRGPQLCCSHCCDRCLCCYRYCWMNVWTYL